MEPIKQTTEAVFVRTFDAPRQMVWDAWTREEQLKEWFGPTGSQITYATMDFRVGGTFHYAMKHPDFPEVWGKWTFKEIDPPKRLQILQGFSNKEGEISAHPMAPTWPKVTLATTTFEEVKAEGARIKTTITLRWEPYEATQEEIDTFNAGRPSMNEGWAGTFARLDEYLVKLM